MTLLLLNAITILVFFRTTKFSKVHCIKPTYSKDFGAPPSSSPGQVKLACPSCRWVRALSSSPHLSPLHSSSVFSYPALTHPSRLINSLLMVLYAELCHIVQHMNRFSVSIASVDRLCRLKISSK